MNLYNLHTNPEALKHHDEAHEKVPALFFNRLMYDHKSLEKREAAIALDPDKSLKYATHILRGRFKAGEAVIAKDPDLAVTYAISVINGRFPEAEKTIGSDAFAAYKYARTVIKGRFPEGEAAMAKDPYCAANYPLQVTSKRFEEGEEAICRGDMKYALQYVAKFHVRLPGLEKRLAAYPAEAIDYAMAAKLDRFKEAEPAIFTHAYNAFYYVKYVIQGPLKEAERAIASNPHYAYRYAVEVLKGRFPMGERFIRGSRYDHEYEKFTGIKL